MSEWKAYKLVDNCEKIGSGATPRGGKEAYLPSGKYALIRSQNVLDFEFSSDGLAFISEEQASKLNNVELKENDILLNITGDSVARVCQVPKTLLPARVNQHVAIIRPKNSSFNPAFLKYYLLNPSFKEYMLGLASCGATRNALTKAMIEDFEVVAPDVDTQNVIAEILSSLDDKIELNNQINENLEALAQTIFKRWFVDFEFPDVNGNPYKSSGGKMIESELGEIPKDWHNGQLLDIAKISKKNVKPFDFPEKVFFHYSLPAFDECKMPVEEFGYTIKSSKFMVCPDSILVSKLNPRFPRIWYVANCAVDSICSTEFQVLEPLSVNNHSFVYCLCNSSSFGESLIAKASGTSGSHQRVRPNDILETPIIIPSSAIFRLFNETTKAMLHMTQTNLEEKSRLKILRDTILPQLISGELEPTATSESTA